MFEQVGQQLMNLASKAGWEKAKEASLVQNGKVK